MENMTLYVKRDTWIHQLNALTKMFYVLVIIVVPLIIGAKSVFVCTISLSLLMVLQAKVFRNLLPMLGAVSFVLLSVVIIQTLVHQGNNTLLWSIYGLNIYQEGLFLALGIALNIYNIVSAFSVFILTTTPASMTEAMIQVGVSPKIAYVFSSVFQIIPQMLGTVVQITDAQRSRGMETEGNIFVRIKAFFPLVSPVIMNALMIAKERAIALEVRGFNSKKKRTFLHTMKNTRNDKIFQVILGCLLLITLIWRGFIWLSFM